jgi:hypothetical protein
METSPLAAVATGLRGTISTSVAQPFGQTSQVAAPRSSGCILSEQKGHWSASVIESALGTLSLSDVGSKVGNAIIEESEASRGVAQPGSAPALGAGGRQFESGRPDQ